MPQIADLNKKHFVCGTGDRHYCRSEPNTVLSNILHVIYRNVDVLHANDRYAIRLVFVMIVKYSAVIKITYTAFHRRVYFRVCSGAKHIPAGVENCKIVILFICIHCFVQTLFTARQHSLLCRALY